ncbi:MAG TPA: hypothetical protein PLF84_13005 [Bryobacteraceae bacterium]|nr:hypothetical protein [Bryobacterales bacterium]HRJ19961.1 hypothetical protein [Bryobacteraceae bacterium]
MDSGTAFDRFVRSMAVDFEKWHDGTGYDLAALAEAGPGERARIESLLLARGVRDWRDVEALAALNSPGARQALVKALQHGNAEIQAAVLRCAPDVASREERIAALVSALGSAEVFGGLTQALLEVEEFHPPEIVDALFRGVLERDGAVAGEFAAMLLYLHGHADSAYDLAQRPFLLRFQEEERVSLFVELCGRVGVDAGRYLGGE